MGNKHPYSGMPGPRPNGLVLGILEIGELIIPHDEEVAPKVPPGELTPKPTDIPTVSAKPVGSAIEEKDPDVVYKETLLALKKDRGFGRTGRRVGSLGVPAGVKISKRLQQDYDAMEKAQKDYDEWIKKNPDFIGDLLYEPADKTLNRILNDGKKVLDDAPKEINKLLIIGVIVMALWAAAEIVPAVAK
jgi:hypothetical protein